MAPFFYIHSSVSVHYAAADHIAADVAFAALRIRPGATWSSKGVWWETFYTTYLGIAGVAELRRAGLIDIVHEGDHAEAGA